VDRRGRPGAGRIEDLPHDASGHGAPAPKEALLLYIFASTQVVSTVKDRYGEPKGGSEWEPIKILLGGDGGSNKTNTASNTRLRLTTNVGQAHAATEVLLDLGTNFHPYRPENVAEHNTRASLTYIGQVGEYHRSDRSLLVKPGDLEQLHTGQAGETHRSDRSKPESPKTPNSPTELQTTPNTKQQPHGTTQNSPKRSPEQKPNRVCTGQTGERHR
jgi:hypothetical protein